MDSNWNRASRKSGGDRKAVISGAHLTKEQLEKSAFFARLKIISKETGIHLTKEQLEKSAFFARLKIISKETGIPYIDILRSARRKRFFDASDEDIEQIAKSVNEIEGQ